jgi:hypothetical protein
VTNSNSSGSGFNTVFPAPPSVSIPAGWLVPEFHFGQIVRWNPFNEPQYEVRGKIVGLFWCGEGWLYEVLVSVDCPMSINYPHTWGTGKHIEIVQAYEFYVEG